MTLSIDEFRALHAATTPGEWIDHWDDVADRGEEEQKVISSPEASLDGTVLGLMVWDNGPNVVISKEDAAFTVAAHNHLPALLDEYEKAVECNTRIAYRANKAEAKIESLQTEAAFWKEQAMRAYHGCVSKDCRVHGAYDPAESKRFYETASKQGEK